MLKPEVIKMAEELRKILGSVKGAKRVEEQFSLAYVVVVENEEQKANAEAVGNELTKQASANGLELEIATATEAEIEEIHKKLLEHTTKTATFKA